MPSFGLVMGIVTMAATVVAAIAACVAAWWAKGIGDRQIQISDFVELFVMPQQVMVQNEQGQQAPLRWNLIIKNASSYPVYLKTFSLNGVRYVLGSNAIPNNPDNWYAIPIPANVQSTLSLDVEFEDYLGRKYSSKHSGIFDGLSWQITSEKRVLVK